MDTFYYAGTANDFRKVVQSLDLGYTDSSSTNKWARFYSGKDQPVLNRETVNKQVMPDVKGMGLRDALFLLESMNMRVAAVGKGKVKTQSIEPGTAINKNLNIKLELN